LNAAPERAHPALSRLTVAIGVCAVGCALAVPVGKAPFNLFFWTAVLLFCVHAALDRRAFAASLRNPIVAGSLSLSALYAASVAWTPAPTADALDQLASYRVLLMPLVFMPVFAHPTWRDRALGALLISLGVVLALSWLQWLHPLPFARATRESIGIETRDAYVFTDRIRQNVHLSLLLLWAAGTWLLAREASPRRRLACAALAVLCVIDMLWLLKGRTGYALVGGLGLYLLHARFGARGLALGMVAAGAAAATLWAGLPVFSERLAGSADEVRAYLDTGVSNATGERLEMWSNSLRMIADAPLLGHGVQSYPALSEAMYAAKGRVPIEIYQDPHQEFLYVGVELGLAGLGVLLAGLAGLWRAAARFDDQWHWLARGMVVAYVSAGLFNCLLNVGWTGYFFGLLLAMVAGRHAQAVRAALPGPQPGPQAGRPAAMPAAAAAREIA
jgi:O-antigen ligase